MRIYDFFRGLSEIFAPCADARRVLSAMVASGIPFGDTSSYGETVRFTVLRRDRKRVLALAQKAGIDVSFRDTGLPAFISKYKKRIGLPVGAALAVILIVMSAKFVWNVRISGNTSVTQDEIETMLASHGFGIGAYLPSLDLDDISKRVAIENDAISWLSVNIKGTVAYVEVRETAEAEKEELSTPSNLVASSDGCIMLVEAYGGKSEVKAGQTVKKGDILVSGVIDSPSLGYRLVRSRGHVYAGVSRTFSEEAPLTLTVREYTGREKTEKNILFFSKNAENIKKINTTYEKYDTIEKTERVSLFGIELPVFIRTVTLLEYTEKQVVIGEETAAENARKTISDRIKEELSENKILNIYESVVSGNESVTVSVTVEFVADIAREQPILTEKDNV